MGNEGSKTKTKGDTSSRPLQGVISGFKSGPSTSVVNQHLETARKSRVLQLKACNMKKVPDSLHEVCSVLRNLELSQNKISQLPSFIGEFTQLKQLHLSSNCLAELPDEIGMLKALEIFNVAENQLTHLPQGLAGCQSLRTLNLSSNRFTSFPVVVTHLMNLEILNLAQNQIAELPDEIATLRASELNLNQNRLSDLPSSALAKCPQLKILRVEENCLEKNVFTEELLATSQLNVIAYAGNLFQDSDFQHRPGYEVYQDRYTATRRKM